MPELFVNDPGTVLAAGCSNNATTISVASSSGYPGTGNFRIKIDHEIMLVTAVAGTSWTVTRGVETTTATTHLSGAAVNHILTAGSYKQLLADRLCYVVFRAGMQQATIPSLGFSTGSDGPTATNVTGTDSITASASFANGVIQRVHDHFLLPTDWAAPLSLDVLWRTAAITNTVKWQIEIGAINVNTIFNPTFNAPTVVTVAPAGTANWMTLTTITGIDTTGLAANRTLYFRFSRLGTTDTLTVPAELLSLRFVMSRTP